MTDLVRFLTCSDLAADLVADPAVAAAWDEPSALAGYRVGALAGHLARAVTTAATYLDRPAPAGTVPTDASGYLATALADHDPVGSDFHARVRQRGADGAAGGPSAVAEAIRTSARHLEEHVDEASLRRPVEVLDGLVVTFGDYLRTRLLEVVVHGDDLAVSVGVATPAFPDAAYRDVAGVLAEVAARRVGGLRTVRSLARAERVPEAVRAL